jgi:hypothetical protein
MTKAKLDNIFAGIQAIVLGVLPFLVLIDVVDLNAEQMAGFSVAAAAVVTGAGRIFAPKADEAAVDIEVKPGG